MNCKHELQNKELQTGWATINIDVRKIEQLHFFH